MTFGTEFNFCDPLIQMWTSASSTPDPLGSDEPAFVETADCGRETADTYTASGLTVIRDSTVDDARGVSELIQRNYTRLAEQGLHPDIASAYKHFNTPERLRRRLESDETLCRIAEIEGMIVGVALFANETPTLARFSRIHVAPGLQGKGLGRTLVQGAMELLRTRKTQKVYSRVTTPSLSKFLAILRRLGFSPSINGSDKGEHFSDLGNTTVEFRLDK